MKRIAHVAAAALLLAGTAAYADTDPEASKAAAKLATETCSSCHGPGGQSKNPTFPVLAAQNRDYIVAQLTAFREHTRGEQAAHDFMYGMARALTDAQIHALAEYFAAQKAVAGRSADAALVAKGKALFEQGDTARSIVACAVCHGPEAKGNGPIPRLAGQHGDYVVKQLLVIQNALRAVPAMHGIVQNLSGDEMQAVAAYVQSRN
jgi:cytochrome c553